MRGKNFEVVGLVLFSTSTLQDEHINNWDDEAKHNHLHKM